MKTNESLSGEKNSIYSRIKLIYEHVKQDMVSTVDQNISPDINSRRSTLSSHALATVLASKALKTPSEKTDSWIRTNAQGMNITGTPPSFSEPSFFTAVCFTILDKVCGFSLPSPLKEGMPSVEDLAEKLDYPLSRDASYTLPFHLASVALFCIIGGIKMPHILQRINDLQQEDGSWADDTINTALSAIALQKEGINPRYDVQKWLKREMLPDGSWAVANGEVWEASFALRTGEVADISQLVNVLTECMHPNYWWGFSRYSVPDIDDTAVACYSLAPYKADIAAVVCTNLINIQNENGGWGAFPQIEGVVPYESVVGTPGTTHNDITCHVLEALELNKRSQSRSFKKGILYLLEAQAQDGQWNTRWWNSDVFGTTEIALLLNRNGYTEPAFHALDWLERKLEKNQDKQLNIVEYSLFIRAFSEVPEYFNALTKAVREFLELYSSDHFSPTFDGGYPAGPIDYKIYRLSIILSALHTLLRTYKSQHLL